MSINYKYFTYKGFNNYFQTSHWSKCEAKFKIQLIFCLFLGLFQPPTQILKVKWLTEASIAQKCFIKFIIANTMWNDLFIHLYCNLISNLLNTSSVWSCRKVIFKVLRVLRVEPVHISRYVHSIHAVFQKWTPKSIHFWNQNLLYLHGVVEH